MPLSKGHKEKDNQLGVSHANATTKLKKHLLFHYVKKCSENFCYVCGEEIETYAEFTLEHKIPWLHNDPNLFWDFDNIAFSHRKCNKPNRQYEFTKADSLKGVSVLQKLKTPIRNDKSEYWCWHCKSYKRAKEFVRNKRNRTRDGLSTECRVCKSDLRIKSKLRRKADGL